MRADVLSLFEEVGLTHEITPYLHIVADAPRSRSGFGEADSGHIHFPKIRAI